MAETDNTGLPFTLKIIERNASFLSDPDEI
jgi:hypothetical protein